MWLQESLLIRLRLGPPYMSLVVVKNPIEMINGSTDAPRFDVYQAHRLSVYIWSGDIFNRQKQYVATLKPMVRSLIDTDTVLPKDIFARAIEAENRKIAERWAHPASKRNSTHACQA
jgi:hypothetical protein